MAVSRFRSSAGCHLYGKLRQTDFLPVGEPSDEEVLERGYYSVSDDDSEGQGLELAFGGDVLAEYEDADPGHALPGAGIIDADFNDL